jgi:hypothetical protein
MVTVSPFVRVSVVEDRLPVNVSEPLPRDIVKLDGTVPDIV